MYAIVSLAITFICYTGDDHHLHQCEDEKGYLITIYFVAFLMFGLKPREPEKKKEE